MKPPAQVTKKDSPKMRKVGMKEDMKVLARELFIHLISLDTVDTVQEMEALMDDAIDLSIEFETKLDRKRLSVIDDTDTHW